MKIDYRQNIRKWSALMIAVTCYFFIHEGAHLLYALYVGTFKQVNFIGLGIQIDIYREQLTDIQLGIFNLLGALSTIIIGYILLACTNKFIKIKSVFIRGKYKGGKRQMQ